MMPLTTLILTSELSSFNNSNKIGYIFLAVTWGPTQAAISQRALTVPALYYALASANDSIIVGSIALLILSDENIFNELETLLIAASLTSGSSSLKIA